MPACRPLPTSALSARTPWSSACSCPARDLVPVLALLALLATAYRHPSGRTEALIGLAAAAATLATGHASRAARPRPRCAPRAGGRLPRHDPGGRRRLRPGRALRRRGRAWSRDASRGRPVRLLGGVFLLAAAVTAVLSLDATVVLLTPVVLGGAVAWAPPSRPGAYACLRMANSASLLLPVSNLTNLLAMPHLDLTFGGFAW